MFVPTQTNERIAQMLARGLSIAETARRIGVGYAVVRDARETLAAGPSGSDERTAARSGSSRADTRTEVGTLLAAGLSHAEIARALEVSKSTVTYHARRLGARVDRRAARRHDWDEIQCYYDAGHSVRECQQRFGFNLSAWSAAAKRGAVIGRSTAMPIEELVSAPRNRTHLKQRLLDAGLLPRNCERCGTSEWLGEPLPLELHHVNGDGVDNRLENLEMLCPNCHSQTDSWGGRNSGRAHARRRGG